MSETTLLPAASETESGFEFRDRLDALRCHESASLQALLADARREQARWRMEELALVRVLDERAHLREEPSLSYGTQRSIRDITRALESLPAIADAAQSGDISWDQLQPLTQIAKPETDREWARRGRNTAPVDLRRMVTETRRVSAEDAAHRREQRKVVTWRHPEIGMADGKWHLPDIDGVFVEKVLDEIADKMRPARGMPWDSLEHRKADALVEVFRAFTGEGPVRPIKGTVVVHAHRAADGIVTRGDVDGIPIADETLQEFMATARIVEQDDDAPPVDYGTTRHIPAALRREIQHRDRHCRYPGCSRTRGLHLHHIDPVCADGHTTRKLLVLLCSLHHRRMEPHGYERLTGDTDRPDGLTLTTVTQRRGADRLGDPGDSCGPFTLKRS